MSRQYNRKKFFAILGTTLFAIQFFIVTIPIGMFDWLINNLSETFNGIISSNIKLYIIVLAVINIILVASFLFSKSITAREDEISLDALKNDILDLKSNTNECCNNLNSEIQTAHNKMYHNAVTAKQSTVLTLKDIELEKAKLKNLLDKSIYRTAKLNRKLILMSKKHCQNDRNINKLFAEYINSFDLSDLI